MKITNAIISVNDISCYQWFWPRVSRLWSVLGIHPILLWVTEKTDILEFPYPSDYGEIRILPILHNDAHQSSLLVRQYGCASIPGVNIPADIDLFPISKYFFVDRIEGIPDEDFAHISAELPYLGKRGKLPTAIYAGSSEVFTRVLLSPPTIWKEVVPWDRTFIEEFISYTGNLIGDQHMDDESFIYQKAIKYAYAGNPFHIFPRWGRRLWNLDIVRKELTNPVDLNHFFDGHLSPRQLHSLQESGEDLFPAVDHLIDRIYLHLQGAQ